MVPGGGLAVWKPGESGGAGEADTVANAGLQPDLRLGGLYRLSITVRSNALFDAGLGELLADGERISEKISPLRDIHKHFASFPIGQARVDAYQTLVRQPHRHGCFRPGTGRDPDPSDMPRITR